MARVMEDSGSDDEFPDVHELAARRGVKKPVSGSARARYAGDDEKTIGKAKSPVKRFPKGAELGRGEKSSVEGVMGKPRKRVLNQKSDNPLLRPLSGKSSDVVGEGSTRKRKGVCVKEVRKMSKNGPKILASNSEHENEDREGPDERTMEFKTAEKSRSEIMESIESKEEVLEEATGLKNERSTTTSKQDRKTVGKLDSKPIPKFESDEEDFGLDSDGLSDFIVDDSTFLEEEDTVIEAPPPRSVRRLVKGRKMTRSEESDDEDPSLGIGKLKLGVEEDASTSLEKALKELDLEDLGSDNEDLLEARPKGLKMKAPKRPKDQEEKKAASPSFDIEDPFTLR